MHAATINWTNAASGGWNTATNWNPNSVPSTNDTAIITNAGNYSVTLDVSPTVAGLNLGASSGSTTQSFFMGGQTLTVNGPIQVSSQGQFNLNGGALAGTNVLTGTLTWSGGSMSGTMTLASTSVLSIVAGGGDGFNGLVLTNYGTVNWTNTPLYGVSGRNAQIYNYGLWNAQSDNTFTGAYNGGPPTLFYNFGTFRKSGNLGATILDTTVVFNNTGTVNVQSGTLNVNGGGTSSGGYMTTASGGIINFSSYIFTNSTTFTGLGSYVAGGATFGGTIVGTLNWDGGSLAGTVTIPTNSVLNIVAGGGDGFNGLVLTNYGTVNWTNTPLYGISGNNAQIYNYGLWNAQSDNTFTGAYNGGPPTLFDNFGTFLKSGHTGVTTLDSGVVFNNTGIASVQSGTLDIGGGTSSGGNFTTATGGIVSFISTAYDFTNSTTFTGIGSYVAGGATFGGTIVGTLNWDGGTLNGVMTLATNSILNIVFGGGDGEFNGLVLTNYGTVNWTNTPLYGILGLNAQIYNYGLWNAQSDNTFQGAFNGGPPTLFDNFGTFRKSGNTGTTILDGNVVFNNTGTVNVQSGTLDINGGGTSSGGYMTTAGGGIINFSSYIFTNSTTFTGIGNYVAGGATFGGTIVGTLNWDGGSLAGTATLTTNSVVNIVAGGGYGFNGLVLTNYGTVNWTNTTLYGVSGRNAQIYNYGLWNAQSDNTFTGAYNGGPPTLFDNFGTFLKSGHTGVSTLDSGVVFNNTGTVNVQSGMLDIGGGTSSGGNFITATGGIVNFISTAYAFTNSTTFTGVGSFVTSGATFGGTIVGTLSWDGGSLSGVMTLASTSVLNIVAGGGDGFNGLVLTNYGTVNWINTTLYGLSGHNAQIYNYGLWNAQSDNTFQGAYNGGSPTLFDNFGTFRKSGNTGATTLDSGVVFNNTGKLDAQSGTIALQGSYTLANGTKMSFGLNGPASNGQISLSGAASFAGSLSANFNDIFFWPVVGSSFTLLSYTSETGLLFTNTALPAFITWQTNYNLTTFTISVLARSTNPAPGYLYSSEPTPTNLLLKWPGDHTGWRIEGQTNPVNVGLTTNWVTIPGSGLTNEISEPIEKTNGSVFFRMVYP